jgi:hypothetical protein
LAPKSWPADPHHSNHFDITTSVVILPDEVFGEFDDVVLLDEAVVVAIKLSTGKE